MFGDSSIEYERVGCALCKGGGAISGGQCPACDGLGSVSAVKPAIPCPRCKGTGESDPEAETFYASNHCLVCRGSGWAMVEWSKGAS
jgi:DnaJ-class molecular chaperone